MRERRHPFELLDAMVAARVIAHEAIYDLERELVSQGRSNLNSTKLLQESARLTLHELPELLSRSRQLAAELEEKLVLDPDVAVGTEGKLREELVRVQPGVARIRNRQHEIASSLRAMVEE